jgi:hypothetical protein
MRRYSVKSGTILSIGYDAKKQILEIEFRSSTEVYRYFNVPPEEYDAFLNAESKGVYLNHVFKPKHYRYTEVGKSRNQKRIA